VAVELLGAYALYQALRKDVGPKKPQVVGQDRASQAKATTDELNVPLANIEKSGEAGIATDLYGFARNSLSSLYDGIKGSPTGGSLGAALANPNFTMPMLAGAPIAGYLGYQVARKLKPNRAEALDSQLKGEIDQFNQVLNREYTNKNAALSACAGLLNAFEDIFEKNAADIFDAAKAWYYPAATLAGTGAGMLTYNMMKRLDPERIAAEAAKDAYRRNQMVQKPKIKVTTVDPGEDPDELAGMSSSDTVMVPMPAISSGYQTKTSALIEKFEKDTGLNISVFNDWYTGLNQTEKVASLVNMVKQAQLNAEQIKALLADDAVLDQAKKVMGYEAFPNSLIRHRIDPNDPAVQQAVNDAVNNNPQLQALVQSKGIQLQSPTAGAPAPTAPAPEAPVAAPAAEAPKPGLGEQLSAGVSKAGEGFMGSGLGKWIMSNPMQAAGIAASLLAMGGGHQAMGIIGLLLSIFGKDIWGAISGHLGLSPQQAEQVAAQQGALPNKEQMLGGSEQTQTVGQPEGPSQPLPASPEMEPPTPPAANPAALEGAGTEGEAPQLGLPSQTPPPPVAPPIPNVEAPGPKPENVPASDPVAPPVAHNSGNALLANMGTEGEKPQLGMPGGGGTPPPPSKPQLPQSPLSGMGTEGETPKFGLGDGAMPPPPNFSVKTPFANNPLSSK
jgi:hypothetical protein